MLRVALAGVLALVACRKTAVTRDEDPCGELPPRSGPVVASMPAAPAAPAVWGPVAIGMPRCAARDALVRAGYAIENDRGIKEPSHYLSVKGAGWDATIYFEQYPRPSVVNQVSLSVKEASATDCAAEDTRLAARYGPAATRLVGDREYSWALPKESYITDVVHPRGGRFEVDEHYVPGGSRDKVRLSALVWRAPAADVERGLREDGYDVKSAPAIFDPCDGAMGNPSPRCGAPGTRVAFAKPGETGTARVDDAHGLEDIRLVVMLADGPALEAFLRKAEGERGRPRWVTQVTSSTFHDATSTVVLQANEDLATGKWSYSTTSGVGR